MANSANSKNGNFISQVRATAKAIWSGGPGGMVAMNALYQQWQCVYGPGGSAPVADADFIGQNSDLNTATLTAFFAFWATIIASMAANANQGLQLASLVGR